MPTSTYGVALHALNGRSTLNALDFNCSKQKIAVVAVANPTRTDITQNKSIRLLLGGLKQKWKGEIIPRNTQTLMYMLGRDLLVMKT